MIESAFATIAASTLRTALRPPLAAALLLAACGGSDYGGGTGTGTTLAPSITAQPASITVAQGQPATFSVTASGYMPIAYQWQRGGADIMGATQASYVLAAASAGDNGAMFAVRVSNLYGTVTSTSATLTVN